MNAYWAQFSHAEILSMHGIESDTYHDDDHYGDVDDMIPEGEPEGCCSGCMDCLGLSWRDFF